MSGDLVGTVPWVAGSLDELVAGAADRVEVRPADARSGGRFERLTIDGERRFLKVLTAEDDWIMRMTGNTTNWEFQVWGAGIYHQLPACIDHTILGMALEGTGPSARLSILMDDCGEDLVPSGDAPLPTAHHEDFVDHMAAMHARFLEWQDDLGLADPARRFTYFSPELIAPELDADDVPGPIAVAERGWRLLPERAPRLDDLARTVHEDPAGLAEALATTPSTFVGGDWKLGNLGHRPDGRTIMIDQAYPGQAAPCWDLTWYLSLNRARLPETKESTIARYREALEARGVETADWFERQLGLSLLGMATVFAWEKAVGDQEELDWWQQAAVEGARWL
ncbi:hypothetical protein [Nocardioides dilutus]